MMPRVVAEALMCLVAAMVLVREMPAQTVVLAAPKGGEVFSLGDVVTIAWTGIPSEQAVTLQYTVDDGLTWQVIAEAVTGGRYLWKIPLTQEAQCRIRVITTGKFSAIDTLDATGAVNGIVFSPDGSLLIDGTQASSVDVWSMRTREKIKTFIAHARMIAQCDISRDGRRLATASLDGSVALWNTDSWTLIHRLIPLSTTAALDVRFSPDGNEVVTAYISDSLRIWDVATGVLRLAVGGPSGVIGVHSVEWSRDGKRIFSTLTDGKVNVWNADDGEFITTLIGHTGQVNQVRTSPDGSTIATASFDSTAILWDATTYTRLRTLVGHSGGLFSAEFDPSGEHLLTTSKDGTAMIWRVRDGVPLDTLRLDTVASRSLFSPDGRVIATAEMNGIIQIWGPPQDITRASFFVTVCSGGVIRDDGLHQQGKPSSPGPL